MKSRRLSTAWQQVETVIHSWQNSVTFMSQINRGLDEHIFADSGSVLASHKLF